MSEPIAVPISKTAYDQLVTLAKEHNRTVMEVVEDAIRAYDVREAFRQSAKAMKSIQEEATRNGTSTMTLEDINEEIAAARREMRDFARTA